MNNKVHLTILRGNLIYCKHSVFIYEIHMAIKVLVERPVYYCVFYLL